MRYQMSVHHTRLHIPRSPWSGTYYLKFIDNLESPFCNQSKYTF